MKRLLITIFLAFLVGFAILWTDDFHEALVGFVTGVGAYVIFMLGRYSR
jgi:hypothetical protein